MASRDPASEPKIVGSNSGHIPIDIIYVSTQTYMRCAERDGGVLKKEFILYVGIEPELF